MRIGVFDSGIGGEAVAANLRHDFPHADIMTVSDREHVPYGSRPPEEIIRLTEATISPLLESGCDVIIIACHTATAVAIDYLRNKHPTQPFVGLEPMLKPAAALSKTKTIAVFATPATLSSPLYAEAKRLHAAGVRVIEPDCSDWARLIEANELNRDHIEEAVERCIKLDVDVIVLGCTHYHWIKHEIIETAGHHVVVLEPSEAIARRVRDLLRL
ncbi:MAG: aspartate/glutamate racemase family protein [Patescibacteria group bacterium]